MAIFILQVSLIIFDSSHHVIKKLQSCVAASWDATYAARTSAEPLSTSLMLHFWSGSPNMPETAVDAPSTWVPAIYVEIQREFQALVIGLVSHALCNCLSK